MLFKIKKRSLYAILMVGFGFSGFSLMGYYGPQNYVGDVAATTGKSFGSEAGAALVAALREYLKPGGEAQQAWNALIHSGAASLEKSKITDFLGMQLVKYSVLSVLAYGVARYVPKLTEAYVAKKVKKPRVIVEWHQEGLMGKVLNFSKTPALSGKKAFPAHVTRRLNDLLGQRKLVKQARLKTYPNICVCGQYGSGKTAVAKEIARQSGRDYAVVPAHLLFEKDGGLELVDELFSWIQNYNGKVCLVIDGADLLFSDRSKLDQSSNEYRVISHFMTCLEAHKNKLMLVTTSNNPVVDRIAQKYITEVVYTNQEVLKADTVAIAAAA